MTQAAASPAYRDTGVQAHIIRHQWTEGRGLGLVAGCYLLSSTDLALLTCSKSRSESTSRTCLCCSASSRRQSWTILDRLGVASF